MSSNLTSARAAVQKHSAELRKELGLLDLVLAQILIIVVPDYMGTAAKAGDSHVVFWLVGIVFFFFPLALVVIHLSSRLPVEGGLYEWARIAFNDRIGFLVAWNLWLFAILYVGLAGLITITFASYAIPGAAWIASSKWLIVGGTIAVVTATMVVASLGLGVGKWANNTGSLFILLVVAVLVACPFIRHWQGTLAEYHPLRLVVPAFSLFNLSVSSKMIFGALCSFEYMAVFAGECRNPERLLPRSVLLTAPVIAVIYILATSSILAFVSPATEDVVAPIPQALSRGLQGAGVAGIVVPVAILFLLFNYLATFAILFTASTRLPMVAGWDHLLPAWFSRLHPRYKTPINSVLALGITTLAVTSAALIGVGPQESYELLLTWAFTFYGLAYLALFAIPLLSSKERGLRPRWWVRLAAASGFLVALLFVALSIFPIIAVKSSFHYSLKIAAVVLGANLVGWLVYRAGRQKNAAPAA